MKKMMMILAMVFTLITTSVFASEVTVSKQVLNAFNSEFANAQEVSWTYTTTFYKASFTLDGQKVFAFYSADGDLLGLSRYISSLQLPISLQTNLKKNYGDKWITDLFEVANTDGTSYFVTLENADTKIILKAVDSKHWSLYKKINKA